MITTTNDSAAGFDREATLLFACACPTLDPAQTEQMRALAQGPIDWEALIDQAERHRVLPLLCRHFDTQLRDLVPAPARGRAERLLRAKVAQVFLLAAELRRVLVHFDHEGIPALAYKGPVMAHQIYGDIALRTFGDLDILVRPVDFPRASRALRSLNYHPRPQLSPIQETALRYTECDQTFVNGGSGGIVELHWAVSPPHFRFPLTTDQLLARAVAVDLSGHTVSAPSNEDLVVLLALNGTKDLWQGIEPACLIASLCTSRAGINWATVLDRAHMLRSERMLRLALALATRLVNAQLPADIRRWIERDPALPALLAQTMRRLAAGSRAGLWDATLIRLRSREHWADGVRHCVMRAVLPNTHDCDLLSGFPAALWPAAAVIRPMRLLARRLARSAKRSRA